MKYFKKKKKLKKKRKFININFGSIFLTKLIKFLMKNLYSKIKIT